LVYKRREKDEIKSKRKKQILERREKAILFGGVYLHTINRLSLNGEEMKKKCRGRK
jgi:hypothetical protein